MLWVTECVGILRPTTGVACRGIAQHAQEGPTWDGITQRRGSLDPEQGANGDACDDTACTTCASGQRLPRS